MLAPLALLAISKKVAPRSLSTIRAWMRVITYAGAVSAFGLGFAVHSAKAAAGEEQLALGRDLVPLADLLKEEHTVLVNGQRAHVATATSNDSLDTVLDRFEKSCEENASPLSDAWQSVPTTNRFDARKAVATASMIRERHANEGTVACLARGAHSGPTFAASVQGFAKTGDLGELGQMRYVYAKRGADGTTFVLTAWTDDTFSVKSLMPKAGEDAPGSDSSNAPRPPKSSRLLSTTIEKTPFVTRAYTSSDTPASALAFYDDTMTKSGWTCVSPSGMEEAARACHRAGVDIAIGALAKDGATLVSITEARSAEQR